MKHLITTIGILAILLPFSFCSDDIDHKMSAQWQLKTVTYPDGSIDKIDTLFYAFQRQTVFSFTVLENAETSRISYGYINYLEEDVVHIKMDRKQSIKDFPQISGWNDFETIFKINKISGNEMIMSRTDTIYTFRKH